MSSFWQNRLQPTQTPQVAPQQPLQAPWWKSQQALSPAVQAAPVASQAPSGPVGAQPAPQTLSEALILGEGGSDQAVSARDADRCPECDSGNYLRIRGSRNAPFRCFDCGYNPLYMNYSSGGISTGSSGPVNAARVQTGGQNNYRPSQIVGRVP